LVVTSGVVDTWMARGRMADVSSMMSGGRSLLLSFDDFELDTEHFELRHAGQPRKVEPKVFDLISHFVQHPEQVFSREELIDAVWQGRLVADTTVSTCIKGARRALHDSGDAQIYIKTLRGRGFIFTAEVTRLAAVEQVLAAASPTSKPTDDMPSLLVAGFRPLSDDAAEQRLAASLGGDLSTFLTRIPLLGITSQALVSGDAMSPGARELCESRGVDFVLGGTVQRLNDRFWINVQLSDAVSGFQLWAEQLSIAAPLADAIEDGVVMVIGKLEPQLQRAIYERIRGSDGIPSARQLFLEANAMLAVQGWHHDSFALAAELLRRSHALDPGFVLAPASLSLVLGLGERIGLTADAGIKAEALEAAELALRLDPMDACVLGLAGCALADLGYPQRALPILRNAVDIKPSNAQAWAALGSVCLMLGQPGQAIECLRRGLSISPLDSRLSIWGALLTLAHLAAGDLDAALQQGDLACQLDDRSYMPRVALAAVHLVRTDKGSAAAALHDALRIKPDLSRQQIASLVGRRLGTALALLKRKDPGSI